MIHASSTRRKTTMTTITTDKNLVTLINIFTVTPENQQRLVDLLIGATQHTMRKQPGYISANIHKSLDGTRVTNYAQWRSREDFETMRNNPEAAAHMREASKLAISFEPHLYEVCFTDQGPSS
jgi:heme-degrading monooxygenase HmoA